MTSVLCKKIISLRSGYQPSRAAFDHRHAQWGGVVEAVVPPSIPKQTHVYAFALGLSKDPNRIQKPYMKFQKDDLQV